MTSAMRLLTFATAALLCAPASLFAQAMTFRISDGRVTLNTHETPASAILARWAEVEGVTIINGDKISGEPLTLQLVDVDEREALAAVLRGAGGYILGERRQPSPTGSTIDRILILPTSSRPVAGAPTFTRPAAAAAFVTEPVAPVESIAPAAHQLPPSAASPERSEATTRSGLNASAASRTPTGAAPLPQQNALEFDGRIFDLIDENGNAVRAPTPIGTVLPVPGAPESPQPLRPADRRTAEGPLGVTIGSTQPGTIAPNQDPRSTPTR